MRIDLHYQSAPPFDATTHEMAGIGGTENFITYSSQYLAQRGHEVTVYNLITTPVTSQHDGATVQWRPLAQFDPGAERDVLISFRFRDVFESILPRTGLKVIMLADTESVGLGDQVRAGKVDLVGFVGRWQKAKIQGEEQIPEGNCLLTSNGVAMAKFDADRDQRIRIPGKCMHMATPERGLPYLLDIWPEIQARVPYASLHLFSSFYGWGVTEQQNEGMTGEIYARIQDLQAQGQRIINHQHAGAQQIRRHLLESELYLYPTLHFDETCCISALEAAAAGVPIVATDRGALGERVVPLQTGYLVRDEDGHDHWFAARAIQALLNREIWEQLSRRSVEYARAYDYAALVAKWEPVFEAHLEARQ